MKKQPIVFLLAIALVNLISCSKNASYFITEPEPEPSLDVSVYPQVAAPGLIALATEDAVLSMGTTATFFVPYRVVADDVQEAVLIFTDAQTGAELSRVSMHPEGDLSLVNVTVPEELQGHRFSFVTLPLDPALQGHAITLRAELKGNKQRSESELPHAFIVP